MRMTKSNRPALYRVACALNSKSPRSPARIANLCRKLWCDVGQWRLFANPIHQAHDADKIAIAAVRRLGEPCWKRQAPVAEPDRATRPAGLSRLGLTAALLFSVALYQESGITPEHSPPEL